VNLHTQNCMIVNEAKSTSNIWVSLMSC